MNFTYILSVFLFTTFSIVQCRKHKLRLKNDQRKYFSITTFGFSTGGQLEVNLNELTFPAEFDGVFGLTLAKTVSDSITPYMESHQDKCLLLADEEKEDGNVEIVSFIMNTDSDKVVVNCNKLTSSLDISPAPAGEPDESKVEIMKPTNTAKFENAANNIVHVKRSVDTSSDKNAQTVSKESKPDENSQTQSSENKSVVAEKTAHKKDKLKSENTVQSEASTVSSGACVQPNLTFTREKVGDLKKISNLKFIVVIKDPDSQGLYSLFFHNCAEFKDSVVPVNLYISITERNGESYLSAGEIPLPRLYFLMSFIFFLTGCVWLYVVRRKKEEAFKIHYLMAVLVFVKSLSLLFHGINFHIIAKDGFPMEAWAVLYYITHLLKGALLFITIVLIGTGWAFIKHILNDKDKKIFMIVIPLQVLANVAKIIMEESEEGDSQHNYWREIFILVDLMCCGAILFPVVWSIRHLQEASQTDGKAAINLEKLKLFRHFYIMIVCYIYFTRIIVYLLKITVPFQYEWMDEMFREAATLVFFILTGYNFRPTTSNPYFRLSQDDDLEMGVVVTQSNYTESLKKTVRSRDVIHGDESIATKRESSHEYD